MGLLRTPGEILLRTPGQINSELIGHNIECYSLIVGTRMFCRILMIFLFMVAGCQGRESTEDSTSAESECWSAVSFDLDSLSEHAVLL